jgi:hypothetical protein
MESYIKGLELNEVYLYSGTDSDSGLNPALPENNYWEHVKKVDK